ncbi:polyketide cyclase [Elizabethkingia miricola]|uniref:SRPBCC family protein n=1 Tax=Elizabethkingia bruuniana TaxID=1756149 RepID=UPI000999FD2F|nr:SRPBCC family protein [Elizabethkingia bruuniana]OPC54834.1 polyketide cyclase [Elizabethkingia bruuniana]OPC66596.1 polyketide cyclase [Elizabethkingia bruuniana]RBI91467.1 polyketide cyclase [Elizabethkingia miricola]
MWQKSYSVITKEVTKEQIWKLTTDIDNWKNWDSSVEDSKLLGDFKVGNFFMLKPKGGPKVKIKLIEIEPYKKFTDLTKFPFAKMYGEHLYEETKDGLKITVTMTVEGILGFIWVKLVAKDIVDNLADDISNQIKNANKL